MYHVGTETRRDVDDDDEEERKKGMRGKGKEEEEEGQEKKKRRNICNPISYFPLIPSLSLCTEPPHITEIQR